MTKTIPYQGLPTTPMPLWEPVVQRSPELRVPNEVVMASSRPRSFEKPRTKFRVQTLRNSAAPEGRLTPLLSVWSF